MPSIISPPTALAIFTLALLLGLAGPRARAQGIDVQNRPIVSVNIEGLQRVSEQLTRNVIRTQPGDAYDEARVDADITRLTRLGRFGAVRARVEPQADGGLALVYEVDELPLLADVQVVGNTAVDDEDLLNRIRLRAGDPLDPFLIERARKEVQEALFDKGHFVAEVTVDQAMLDEQGVLVFRCRQGPLVRIRAFRFEGNTLYADKALRTEVKSETYVWVLRRGALKRQQLDVDASNIRRYYQDRGHLDAQVGRRIDVAPDQRDAVVTFLIDEGPRFTLGEVRFEGVTLFSDAQLQMVMPLKPGDVFTSPAVQESLQAILDQYKALGYMAAAVSEQRLFHTDEPVADLVVQVDEGTPATVGNVTIRGNNLTKDKVVLRQLRGLDPGRRFDGTKLDRTRRNLRESQFFSESSITLLGEPQDEQRDVLVEVVETNTGQIRIGAGISSDSGVAGAFEVTQSNFDIADWPADLDELISQRAFRGAGQRFDLSLSPGNQVSTYSVRILEPYLLESDFSLDTNAFFRQREYSDYDEERFGGGFGFGRRFGDVWSSSINFRFENIDIGGIARDAAVDVYEVEGNNFLTTLGLKAVRNTTDSSIFPTEGSRSELGIEFAGALGGDFDYPKATAQFVKFWTVDQDYLERKTVFSWEIEAGYIFNDNAAPIFERFYAGGHRTFRGFAFRGAGPRGIRADTGTPGDDAVGGDFMLLSTLEYNFPVFKEFLRGVVFTDLGTVQSDFGLDQWRMTVGTGLRLQVPFITGPVPFALDFAVPLKDREGDDRQIFSFDAAIPFQ